MRKNQATIAMLVWLVGATAQAAPEPAFKIRVAYPSVGTLVSGQAGAVLRRTDALKSRGFDATVIPLPLGRELKSALVAGQVDVIFTSETNFVVLLGEGFDAYAIGSLGSGGDMALVVKPDSPVHTLGDFKGRKIATIFGTSIHEPAVEWLRGSGLVPGRDVSLVNLRGMGPLNSAFAGGEVDGIMTFDPYLIEGVKRKAYRVIRRTDLDLIIVMSGAYARANPTALPAFREAVKDAVLYMDTHKGEVNGWASELSGISAATLDEGSRANANYVASSRDAIDLGISPRFLTKLEHLGSFLLAEKLIEHPAAVRDHVVLGDKLPK